jgi:DNA-binding NarL/FixJ family response regulator
MIKGVQILFVDDHALFRSSLGLLLSTHGAVVIGEAEDGESAIAMASELRPDIILIDITLPAIAGIEATRQICQSWPEAKVLALTMHAEDLYLTPFLDAGGVGNVRKSAADREVLKAIEAIQRGETFLQNEGIETLMRKQRAGARMSGRLVSRDVPWPGRARCQASIPQSGRLSGLFLGSADAIHPISNEGRQPLAPAVALGGEDPFLGGHG